MSDRYDPTMAELSPEERAAAEAVRSLGAPAASAAFRSRLRAEFVAGSLRSSRPAPSRRRSSWVAPLAAAAVLLAMFTVRGVAPQSWQILSVDASHVIVDGRHIEADVTQDLAAALSTGRRVSIPDGGRLEILSEGRFFLQLNGGVEVELPRRQGDAFASKVAGSGTLRVATGPRFEGDRYLLFTEAADLEVTGTTFTVISSPGESCVCVLEGSVSAGPPGHDDMQPIDAGGRMTFHDYGRDVGQGRMLPNEEIELSRIAARHQELFSQP